MRFIAELKRRNVFRVGVAYLITAWLILQMTDVLSELLSLPEQVGPVVVALVSIGFPLALIFAWAFELTSEGVKRETVVDSSQSITGQTGKKLNVVILALMALAIVYLLVDKFYLQPSYQDASSTEQAVNATVQPAPGQNVESKQPTSTRPSIAVLPFDNRSNLEEDVFFVQGIHDDLLTSLARIGDMKVISRTTVSQYANSEKTLPVIASELGVAHIMEGAVQRAGDTVRINVQLIKADSDEHVWAEIFDRQLTAANLFEIQSEISSKIASVLKSTLTPQERNRLNDRPTENLAAYNAYLRGLQALARYSSDGADQALVEFRRAVELDPDFALAWAALAKSAAQGLFLSDLNRNETLAITREAADRAMSLNDQIAESHLARASLIRLEKGEWVPEYEEALLRAIELSPGLAEAWLNYSRFLNGRNTRGDEALKAALRAAELDPLSTRIQSHLVNALSDLGRFDEAEQRLNELIQLDESFAINYVTMANLRAARGDYAEALKWRRISQQWDPGNILFHLHELWLLTSLGLEDQYDDLLSRIENLDPDSSTLAMANLFISMRRGNLDAALEAANAWVRAYPAEDNSRYFLRSVAYNFRGEAQKAAADMKLGMGGGFQPESLIGMARDAPGRACLFAAAIYSGEDEQLGIEMAQAAIRHVDQQLLPHQVSQLNLYMSVCHLVTGDVNGALQRLEKAVEDGQLDSWWYPMSHPLYRQLDFEPRYLNARKQIEDMMAEQRQRFLDLNLEERP